MTQEAQVLNKEPAARDAAHPSIIDQWCSRREHTVEDHLIYALVRATYVCPGQPVDDVRRSERVARALARAFSPGKKDNKADFACLQRELYPLTQGWFRIDQATFLQLTDDETELVKRFALDAFVRLRSNIASLRAFCAPEPPPRPKRPYVRGQ